MPALTNTDKTVVTDRTTAGVQPDTSPPTGTIPGGGGGGGGTVTSVATGTGLTGGTITTSGTLSLANTAVVAGSYSNANITVDAQGRLTFAEDGSSGGGGTVTSVATGTGLTGGTITGAGTISLANTAVTPGAYTLANITVDQQGRITAASSGSAGAGTVTSVATGAGLTGGTITNTGTISLAAVADASILANVSGASAAPSATTLSAIMDKGLGTARGNVVYRGASVWSALAPGSSGQFLKTLGAGADPAWASPAGAGTVTSVGITGANGIGVSGSPITGAGTIALTLGDISSATSKPSATGSVARSFAVRETDVFNVKDFGALGDGSTNDRLAIQAAINAAGALSNGGTVYFPPGVYNINAVLSYSGGKSIAFRGDGPSLVTIQQTTINAGCIDIQQTARYVTFLLDGFRLTNSNNSAVHTGAAIKVANTVPGGPYYQNAIIRNLYVKLNDGGASCFKYGIHFQNMQGAFVDNYTFIGNNARLANPNSGSAIFLDVYPNGVGGSPVKCNEIFISNCNVALCGDGLLITSDPLTPYDGPEGVHLTACDFFGVDYGIRVADGLATVIDQVGFHNGHINPYVCGVYTGNMAKIQALMVTGSLLFAGNFGTSATCILGVYEGMTVSGSFFNGFAGVANCLGIDITSGGASPWVSVHNAIVGNGFDNLTSWNGRIGAGTTYTLMANNVGFSGQTGFQNNGGGTNKLDNWP